MKICYITAEYPPQIGGVGDYVQHMSREMYGRGHEVTVVTSVGLGPAGGKADGNGARILPVMRKWDIFNVRNLLRVLADVAADVYVLEFVVFMYGRGGVAPWLLPFTAAFRRRRKPLVVNVHEIYRPQRPGFKGAGLSYASFLVVKVAVRAGAVVVVTNAYRAKLVAEEFGVDPSRVNCIPVGANILPRPGVERPGNRRDGLRLVSFGFWCGDRALEDVIAAVGQARNLRPVHLQLIGSISVEAERAVAVRRLADQLRLNGRFEITGALPAPQVSAYLSAADIFIAPLTGGPSGRRGSLLAALAHGLPVVAYDGREREGIFRDGDNIILVPESDVAGLAAAMDRLAADGALRSALGARARATFEEHFAWPKIAERWDREVFALLSRSS